MASASATTRRRGLAMTSAATADLLVVSSSRKTGAIAYRALRLLRAATRRDDVLARTGLRGLPVPQDAVLVHASTNTDCRNYRELLCAWQR